MELLGLKTDILKSGDNLIKALEKCLKENSRYPKEGDIFAFSSKIVALSERRILKKGGLKKSPKEKKLNLELKEAENEILASLIEAEADYIMPGEYYLTIKNGIFVANAGIDESNAPSGYVIPWPKYPYDSAEKLRNSIAETYNLRKVGVIIVDSVCTPLRAGTTGVAIGYSGFHGVIDKRGASDLFGNKLKVTQMNIADSLAVSANLLMGEADEATPFVLIRDFKAKFTNEEIPRREISIDTDKCLFKGLYPKDIF